MKTRDHYRAGKRLWSPADDADLRRRYPSTRSSTIARHLRRTLASIYQRARTLGLHKSAAFLASPAACRLRRRGDDHPGKATQFPPGHVPANKGLRRPGYAAGRGRMQETQFKTGATPHTWVPVGTEVCDSDGYRKRKVADDRTQPSRVNWRFMHVIVWEQGHGPVPAGHAIAFRNGDKTDVRLDNLECITRRALMARNTVHNLPKPLAQAVQLLGALNRKLRRSTRDAEHDRRSA